MKKFAINMTFGKGDSKWGLELAQTQQTYLSTPVDQNKFKVLQEDDHGKVLVYPPDDKESIGCSQFPEEIGSPLFPQESVTLKDKQSVETTQDMSIGSSLLCANKSNHSMESNDCLESMECTASLPTMKKRKSTSGKTLPILMEHVLNSDKNHSKGTKLKIGNESGPLQKRDKCLKSQQTCEYCIIAPCVQLLQILANQLQWSEPFKCSLVRQALVNLAEPGKKQAWMLILKTRGLNSGTATKVKKMLSSMNFEEVWILPTFLDGSTDILSEWRLKEPQAFFGVEEFGSPRISIPLSGIPVWTTLPWGPYSDV